MACPRTEAGSFHTHAHTMRQQTVRTHPHTAGVGGRGRRSTGVGQAADRRPHRGHAAQPRKCGARPHA
eukprot:357666-Chlamydomonas_euryale.AAC.3